jgi:hypothetical protein
MTTPRHFPSQGHGGQDGQSGGHSQSQSQFDDDDDAALRTVIMMISSDEFREAAGGRRSPGPGSASFIASVEVEP